MSITLCLIFESHHCLTNAMWMGKFPPPIVKIFYQRNNNNVFCIGNSTRYVIVSRKLNLHLFKISLFRKAFSLKSPRLHLQLDFFCYQTFSNSSCFYESCINWWSTPFNLRISPSQKFLHILTFNQYAFTSHYIDIQRNWNKNWYKGI